MLSCIQLWLLCGGEKRVSQIFSCEFFIKIRGKAELQRPLKKASNNSSERGG